MIVTTVPPAAGPLAGSIPLIAGAGGALNVNSGRVTLTDCTIDHCGVGTYLDVGQMSKSASGGGIYIAGAAATASFVNCRLTANWMSAESQDVDGGGMYVVTEEP